MMEMDHPMDSREELAAVVGCLVIIVIVLVSVGGCGFAIGWFARGYFQ